MRRATVFIALAAVVGISIGAACYFLHRQSQLPDKDGDGFSDYFEEKIAKTDPNVPNNRYIILVNNLPDPKNIDGETINNTAYDVFIKDGRIPKSNVIKLFYRGRDANLDNFKKALDTISKKANEDDITAIFLIGDGYVGGFGYLTSYEEIGKMFKTLYPIRGKKLIVIDSCFSGSAIQHLEGPDTVVITQSADNETAGALSTFDVYMPIAFSGPSKYMRSPYNKYIRIFSLIADEDGNGYVSCLEGFRFGKKQINTMDKGLPQPRHPQISDISNIAKDLYLVEIPV